MLKKLQNWLGIGPLGPLANVPFPQLAAAWMRRVQTWPLTPPATQDGTEVAILVTPWLGSAVPFYNIEIALMLAAAGQRVVLLWDSTDVIGNAPAPHETAAIAEALKIVPPWIKTIDVSQIVPSENWARDTDGAWIDSMLFENGVWRMRGETTATHYVERKQALLPRIREHIGRVRELFATRKWHWLLIPGGVWGVSSIYVSAAEQSGCRYATYDCAIHSVTVCHQGVACHQLDLADAAKMVARNFTTEQLAYLRGRAWKELEERIEGRGNQQGLQMRAAGKTTYDFNVIIPLNQRWDAAALGRGRLFATVEEWIVGLLRWAESEPAARLCVRQHPCERFKEWRGSDDIAALIQRENRAGARVRFVAAGESISTYELLPTAKAVVPYTSSVGVEAGMLGISVIASAHNYYDRASFVRRPETQEEFFNLLSQAVRNDLKPPQEGASDAALIYHLIQECNITPTIFAAGPVEYLEWVKIPPRELWAQPSCVDLRESLLTGQPLSYLMSRRILSTANLL